ncbi:IPT/TIG domain-containing protein [Cryptosporangium minutisporangium]|uniref:IPT/TIG domain-containing protein n=2 Tax=Cryptosporangium minutisporangium TaxID=113569 RepID=A0ABP6T8K1_9ACTN
MTIQRPSTTKWTARVGIVAAVTATTLVATANPSQAAPITVSPASGAGGTYINLNTTTANTFSPTRPDAPEAVQFQTAACNTALTTTPTPGRIMPDVATAGTTTVTETGAGAFVNGDVGKVINGTGIPSGATITAVDAVAGTATISAAATGTASGLNVSIGVAAGPYPAQSVRYITPTRLVVQVPPLPAVAAGTRWYVCVYSVASGASTVIANTTAAAFTSYPVANVTAVEPNSGPSAGGNTFTIEGTGFGASTTANTVTIGGVAARVTAATASLITAVAPPGLGADRPIVVTTPAGQATFTTPTEAEYDYLDALSVTPQTAPATAAATLVITGSGFSGYNWSGVTPLNVGTNDFTMDNSPHIILSIGGLFSPTADQPAFGAAAAECINAVALSDTELICTLDPTVAGAANHTNGAAVRPGAYQVQLIDDTTPDADVADAEDRVSVVTSGSTFTIAPY